MYCYHLTSSANLLFSIALAHLCEFIEDCEFTKLSVQILHLLGLEGPKTKQPTKFIRYIYNRVVLENAVVRAAAVSSLAKFGVSVEDPTITKSVNVLLRRYVVHLLFASQCVDADIFHSFADVLTMLMTKSVTELPCTSKHSRRNRLPTPTSEMVCVHVY
jgi:hypothetical protein